MSVLVRVSSGAKLKSINKIYCIADELGQCHRETMAYQSLRSRMRCTATQRKTVLSTSTYSKCCRLAMSKTQNWTTIGRINGMFKNLDWLWSKYASCSGRLYRSIVWFHRSASTVESEPQQPPQLQRPSNAFPKKYHGSDDAESSASEHHRNTIRHYHHRQQAPQHRRRIPNQYANQHLAKVFSHLSTYIFNIHRRR